VGFPLSSIFNACSRPFIFSPGRAAQFLLDWFSSIEELMRNGVLWIAFTGAVLTTLRGRHIAFDILPRFLKDKKKVILDWVLSVSASITCLLLAWLGVSFLRLEIEMESKIGGFCPAWIVEIIIPIGFVLLSIVFPLRVLDGKYDEVAK
jgi:TRAP-type C4-dicarboxylate transport system permease small subunit